MSLIKSRRWLTPKVLAKIRELMAKGWGARRIAKQLKKLSCHKGPTTIWTVMCEIRAEDAKKLEAKKLDDAKKLQKDDTVQRLEAKVEIHETTERIRQKGIEDERLKQKAKTDLYLKMAKTLGGRKELFTEELTMFLEQLLGRSEDKLFGKENRLLWRRIVKLCKTKNLGLHETLKKVAGTQTEFEKLDPPLDLVNYLADQISDFLDEQDLQQKFVQELRKCPICGRRNKLQLVVGTNKGSCLSCGAEIGVSCPRCGGQIKLEDKSHFSKDYIGYYGCIEKGMTVKEILKEYKISEYVYCCVSCKNEFELEEWTKQGCFRAS